MADTTIPPEVWRAAMSTYHREIRRNPGDAWQAAIRAALEAWPGAYGPPEWIILPLNTENPDAEA